jgi:chloramphenicol-sensitive protein RarD
MAHRIVWSLSRPRRPSGPPRWGWLRPLLADRASLRRLACAAVLIAGNWALYIWGVNNEHVVETSLGYFINPVVTVLIGVLVLHERLRRCSGWLSRSGPRQWSS